MTPKYIALGLLAAGFALAVMLLTGCSALDAYNRHVAAREDSVTVLPNENGQYGGEYTHRVEYRSYK